MIWVDTTPSLLVAGSMQNKGEDLNRVAPRGRLLVLDDGEYDDGLGTRLHTVARRRALAGSTARASLRKVTTELTY